jgi:uncharacterized protein YjbI with pentapeptide repeats
MVRALKKLNYKLPRSKVSIGKINSQSLRTIIHDFFINRYVRADDTLLFYYSGHGILDAEGDVYLAPSDIDPDLPLRKGFPFYYVTKLMNMCTSTRIVTILDCCYSGAAKLKGDDDVESKKSASHINEKSKMLKQGQGKCLLAASQGYQEAVDLQEKSHSLFTYYLLEGIKGHKLAMNEFGNVTVTRLNEFVYNQVTDPRHKLKQQPVSRLELSGDITLASYPTLFTLLKAGNVKGFNIMKKKNHNSTGRNTNLSNLDLSKLDLQNIDLSHTDLTNSLLIDTNLSKAKLDGAVLVEAKLDGANLSRTSAKQIFMESASLIKSNLGNSYFYRANLKGCKLNDAILWRTTLDGADLSKTDLSNTELSNAVCSTTKFKEANLSMADLYYSHLWSANLTGANFERASLLQCIGFTNVKCENADFKNAIINDSKIIRFLENSNIRNFDSIKNANEPFDEEPEKNHDSILNSLGPIAQQHNKEISHQDITYNLTYAQSRFHSNIPIIGAINKNRELIIIKKNGDEWNDANISTMVNKKFTGYVNIWEIQNRKKELLTCITAVDTDNRLCNITFSGNNRFTINTLDYISMNNNTSITNWQIYEPDGYVMEHLAYINDKGELVLFYKSDREVPRILNLSAKTGQTVAGRLINWQICNKLEPYPIEFIAGVNKVNELVVFSWSPDHDWIAENISKITSQRVLSPPTAWINNGLIRIILFGLNNDPMLFYKEGNNQWKSITLPKPEDRYDIDPSLPTIVGQIPYPDIVIDYVIIMSKKNFWVYMTTRENHWRIINLSKEQIPTIINNIYTWSIMDNNRVRINLISLSRQNGNKTICKLMHSSLLLK